MRKTTIFYTILLAGLGMLAAVAMAQAQPAVEFSPQGTVKGIKQVRARFSEAMVPFGFLKQPLKPFATNCASLGKERWADERNWLFDFNDALPAGVKCRFTLESGVKTLSGKELGGQKVFEFSTGGPAILSSRPWESSNVAEDQIFVLVPDTEVNEGTVQSGLTFSVEGIRESVGVRIVTGSERDVILKRQYMDNEARKRSILVQARQNFPSGAKIRLNWSKSIQSRSGVSSDQDQHLDFTAREEFTATFNCERENAESDCIPMLPMYVSFSAPISREDAKQVLVKAGSRTFNPTISEEERGAISGVSIAGPFPEKTTFQLVLPRGLKDDANRPLANANRFPLTIKTAEYPPLAKFAAPFGILELKEGGGILPVTLRNVEAPLPVRSFDGENQGMFGKKLKLTPENVHEVMYWIRRVHGTDRRNSVFEGQVGIQTQDMRLPRANGEKAFEVIGIPLGGPGFYVIELESRKLGNSLIGEDVPMYVPAAALVTNLAVHFKWGRETSLIWVTALDTGKPVARAQLSVRSCDGQVLWSGTTDAEGTARPAGIPSTAGECKVRRFSSGLMVTAVSGSDMSFVHTDWDNGIESWRFNLPSGGYHGPTLGHTVFARTLLRAGDVLNMKHVLRNHRLSGFAEMQASGLPRHAIVTHQGSGQNFEFPLAWQAGASETTWRIPKDAKLGEYTVSLRSTEDENLYTGSFQVEEFRVPLMRGIIKPPSESLVSVEQFPVDLGLSYLSGGGAGNAGIRFRHIVRRGGYPEFPDLDDFVFANGPVKEGKVQSDEESESESEEPDERLPPVQSQNLTLDKAGTARVEVKVPRDAEHIQRVETEMEFRDPNGVVQTVSRTIQVYPSDRFVGIKQDSWMVSKDNLRFQVMVVDLRGRPVAGSDVRVTAFERKSYSHRKRLVGGYYAYDNTTETKRLTQLCEGKSDARGLVFCQSKLDRSGNIILVAESKDSRGTAVFSNREIWVAGDDAWWFRPDEGDRMDLIPEKKRYEPGETARFQVRMPFTKGTALITVEREGVAERFVKELSGKQPMIEIPVKGTYAPNIFVSVMVVRGRVADPRPTALVDLGKPSYRLGIASIGVGQRAHELKVRVSPDTDVYRVRGKAMVRISATLPDGKPAAGAEVALSAVDEGLLELKPNTSWALLAAMMGTRGYEVRNSTGQMQVVGRRHFGLKALPPGGGGGKEMTRELFDTLLLWRGRVRLDQKGEALVEVPLNDSLTSFKIVAVATSGANFFGTGDSVIRTTQDLMVLPGIPPLVREGDKFRAEMTVRNTTNRPMSVELAGSAKSEPGQTANLPPLKLELAAGEAVESGWEIDVPVGAESMTYEIRASDKSSGGSATERLKITQKVVQAVQVRTYQATLEQLSPEYKVVVERPVESIPGRGSVGVSLSPTIVGSLESVREYMRLYPYNCLEQMTSRAIVLRDKERWKQITERLPMYLDSDGFAKFFPDSTYGSEWLTSYLLAISNEAGYELPVDARERMLGALKNFVAGKVSRSYQISTSDLSLRKVTAIEALSRYDEAKPDMFDSIQVQPNLWPTSTVLEYYSILRRVQSMPQRDTQMANVDQILRGRLNFQGTILKFRTDQTDNLWWLFVSGDMNALKLILANVDNPAWREDMPRLVRGAIDRRHRGHWDLTIANAWGVLALEKFAAQFERVTVGGKTQVSLNNQNRTQDWNTSRSAEISLPWPEGRKELAIRHEGAGRPWALVSSRAALPLKEPLSAGFRIEKTVTPIEQKKAGVYTRGDVVRVTLKLRADTDRTWVVVSDPVPAGSTILGTGLGRESAMLQQGEKREGWVWPSYEERSHEAFRAYYEYIAQGEWTVEYTVRLNQSGTFSLPQTRIEAMYSPEMFAEFPNNVVKVLP